MVGALSLPLFTNRWKNGDIAPAGHVLIESFHLDYSVPVWTYEVSGGRQIEARIWMEPGAHTTYVGWRVRPSADPLDDELSLRITLLANDRDHHGTTPIGGFEPEIRAWRATHCHERPALHADHSDDRRRGGDEARLVSGFRAHGRSRAAWTRLIIIFASAR
jgi:4-alpha-glucanotransferase